MSKLIEGRRRSSRRRARRGAATRGEASGLQRQSIKTSLKACERTRAALSQTRDTGRAAHRAHGRASPEGGRHGSLLEKADAGGEGGRLIKRKTCEWEAPLNEISTPTNLFSFLQIKLLRVRLPYEGSIERNALDVALLQ